MKLNKLEGYTQYLDIKKFKIFGQRCKICESSSNKKVFFISWFLLIYLFRKKEKKLKYALESQNFFCAEQKVKLFIIHK